LLYQIRIIAWYFHSVRTTPISMVLGTSEYNDDHDGEFSSRINSLGNLKHFI